jgi:hypothetical protein
LPVVDHIKNLANNEIGHWQSFEKCQTIDSSEI